MYSRHTYWIVGPANSSVSASIAGSDRWAAKQPPIAIIAAKETHRREESCCLYSPFFPVDD